MKKTLTIEDVARACHEANKALCDGIGDNSQQHWNEAAKWQQESAVKGVQFRLENPDAKPSSQHEAWLRTKRADGWVYGEVKDAAAKTHPCMVPYDQLPVEQKAKDALFVAVVDSLKWMIE